MVNHKMKGAVLPLLNHKMSIQLPQCNSAVRAHIESRPNALNTRLIVAMVMLLLRSSFEIWDSSLLYAHLIVLG